MGSVLSIAPADCWREISPDQDGKSRVGQWGRRQLLQTMAGFIDGLKITCPNMVYLGYCSRVKWFSQLMEALSMVVMSFLNNPNCTA